MHVSCLAYSGLRPTNSFAATSYPAMHIFESRTRYDTPSNSLSSIILVFLVFFPPGLMKSFLTLRTGNASVHVWAFHAISPRVTIDTRLSGNLTKMRSVCPGFLRA